MSLDQSESVLLKALPPETDYLTYLTILEYNLNEDQLPTLHQVLQDTKLTTNIGWDLVHLLLPLLPHSKSCLEDVARLGNPREVVLKVSELLESLGIQNEDAEEENEEHGSLDEMDENESGDDGGSRNGDGHKNLPAKELQFCALLEMLQILLPRIKTKFPTRFLSTSLQAILPAYTILAAEPHATETIIAFIKALSGTSRPKLPPRASSATVPTIQSASPQSAPDPEGNDGSVDSGEADLQKRLLQSFLTFVIEAWMTALPLVEDVPGMAWCNRIREHDLPQSIIPGRRTFTELFDSGQGYLHSRDATVGQFTALSRDLSLPPSELLNTLSTSTPPTTPPSSPSHPSEIPLSTPGALYLLTASLVATHLFSVPSTQPPIPFSPHYTTLTNPTSPLALIDAVLALSTLTTPSSASSPISIPASTLQHLALLSASTPNAPLRYSAHLLTSHLLHSHPDAAFRMQFITDTLRNPPSQNLKASAVGWVKDEILLLRADVGVSALQQLSPLLFVNPGKEGGGGTFLESKGFYLAVLNLMFLVFSSSLPMEGKGGLEALVDECERWMRKVREAVGKLRKLAREMEEVAREVREFVGRGIEGGGESMVGMHTDLNLLEGNIEMVEEAIRGTQSGQLRVEDPD